MALQTYRELLERTPKNTAFIADSSFLIDTIDEASEAAKLKNKLIKNGSILTYNVTIKSEVIHYARLLMIERILDGPADDIAEEIKKLWKKLDDLGQGGHQGLKQLSQSGYVDLYQYVFGRHGEKLNETVDAILAGCTYADTKSFKVPLRWPTMFSLMAVYGLDSSDAMILNLAVSDKTFKGIISGDGDFIFCSDGLDVILPRRSSMPKSKPHLRPLR